MSSMIRRTLSSFVTVALAAGAVPAADWPQYRGPGSSGAALQPWVVESPAGVGLRVAWKAKLGSGDSDVVVVGDGICSAPPRQN